MTRKALALLPVRSNSRKENYLFIRISRSDVLQWPHMGVVGKQEAEGTGNPMALGAARGTLSAAGHCAGTIKAGGWGVFQRKRVKAVEELSNFTRTTKLKPWSRFRCDVWFYFSSV